MTSILTYSLLILGTGVICGGVGVLLLKQKTRTRENKNSEDTKSDTSIPALGSHKPFPGLDERDAKSGRETEPDEKSRRP